MMLTCNTIILGDPWRDATVSSTDVSVPSTASQPIGLGDGFHCSDLITSGGVADVTVATVQKAGLASMKTWLAAWKPATRGGGRVTSPRSVPQPASKISSPFVLKPINGWFKQFGTAR